MSTQASQRKGAVVSGQSSGGGGSGSLQDAYDNGNTIQLAAATPIELDANTNPDMVVLDVDFRSVTPPGNLGVLDLTMDDATASWAALAVELVDAGGAPNAQLVRAYDAGRTNVLLELTPTLLHFGVPGASVAYAEITATEGKRMLLRSDRSGATGDTAGDLKIGPAFGGDDVFGGLTFEGTTGRVRVDPHALGATIGDDLRNALRIPNVGGADNAAECDPPEEGDTVLRVSEVAPAPERTIGFRGFRDGDWGLFARGFQRTFEDADLAGGVLTVDHNLDTRAPIVAIYDDVGNYVPIETAPLLFPSVAEGADPANQLAVAVTATSITGTWRITVMGF